MCRVARSWCALLALSLLAHSAYAAWTAYQWGSGGSWVPTAQREIIIYAPGFYKFYATDGGEGGALQDIQRIFVHPSIGSGEVVVHILRDPNCGGGPGCTELGSLDLTNATSGVLAECRIAGDAATLDEVRATDLTGPMVVDGGFQHPV